MRNLQQVLQLTAFYSGIALLPMTIVIMFVMVRVTGKLVGKFGFKSILVAGLMLMFLALILFTYSSTGGNFWSNVLPASLIGALGMSFAYIPGTMASLSGVRPEQTGLASGIVNTSFQVGSAIGLAITSVIASSVTRQASFAGFDTITALNHGFHSAYVTASILAVAAVVITVLRIKRAS